MLKLKKVIQLIVDKETEILRLQYKTHLLIRILTSWLTQNYSNYLYYFLRYFSPHETAPKLDVFSL